MIDNRVKIIILAEGKQAASEIKGLSGEFDRLGGSAGKTSDLMKTALKFGGVAGQRRAQNECQSPSVSSRNLEGLQRSIQS